MKVLMIDDDPLVIDQMDLLFTLRWPEVDFVSASAGKPGYRMAEIIKPDLIILDMGSSRHGRAGGNSAATQVLPSTDHSPYHEKPK